MEIKPIEDILAQIVGYYDSTRGVGHTFATLNGFLNAKSNMVVLSKNNTDVDIARNRDRTVSLWRLDHLKGTGIPLVFDNAVLRELFQSALMRITELKRRTYENPLA